MHVPRTRGDEPCRFRITRGRTCMFPAPAGMSPLIQQPRAYILDVPRTRGDEPDKYGRVFPFT